MTELEKLDEVKQFTDRLAKLEGCERIVIIKDLETGLNTHTKGKEFLYEASVLRDSLQKHDEQIRKYEDRIATLEGYERIVKDMQERGFNTYMSVKDFLQAHEELQKNYDKQKEINKELVDENESLKKSFVLKDIARICEEKDEAQKTALYNLDGWRKSDAKLEKANARIAELVDDVAAMQARIEELKNQIRQIYQGEAQDLRSRFPC